MRPECARAAAPYRLALPGRPLGGRLGERLGRGTGSSLEFMDYRDYVPGDDLRHVDWAACARTDQLKVRQYREEVSPALDILVDGSPSMAVTAEKRTALEDLVEACASWTLAAGGLPRRLLGGAGPFERWSEVDGRGADDLLPRVPLRRRAMRLVVSDFLVPDDPAPRLRRLSAGASHLYVLQLLDPWEVDPQAEGEHTLVDCERSSRLDIVLDRPTLDRYRARLRRLTGAVEQAVRAIGGSYALVPAGPPGRMFREHLLTQGIVEPA
ncbi:MAG: DUF58 domain-containing protein [Planctomycetota bacterium]